MFGLDDVLGGLQAVNGIVGMFGANRRAKEAQEYRMKLLNDYKGQLDKQHADLVNNNLQALRRTTGVLGDQLNSRATNLGAADAAAGVYNSSATAGSLVAQGAANAQAIAGADAANFQSEQQLLNQSNQDVLGRELGYADQDVNYSRNQQVQAGNSLVGGLSAIQAAQSAKQNAANRNRSAITNPGGTDVGNGIVSGVQSAVQSQPGVGVNSPGVNLMSPRNNGPYLNGNQGGSMLNLPAQDNFSLFGNNNRRRLGGI